MFENRVLRRVFGPKREELAERGRKLHKEELRDLYSPKSIIRMIKSIMTRWVGHVERMGKKEECVYDIGGKARRKDTIRKTET
jgi:hypothetical protein